MHDGLTIEVFLAGPGHVEIVPDDTRLSPTVLDWRLAARADEGARIEALSLWIAEVEDAVAASPAGRQGPVSATLVGMSGHTHRAPVMGAVGDPIEWFVRCDVCGTVLGPTVDLDEATRASADHERASA